jgi:hypothetical protein
MVPWHRLENLDLRENAELLRLKLTCKGLTAFKEEKALPVDRVSGDLDIKKGEIHVSSVNGRFGKSTIETGSLFLKDLYVNDPYVRVTASGSFRVEDLLTQTHLKLVPSEVREKFQQIEGRFRKTGCRLEHRLRTGMAFSKNGKRNDHLYGLRT